MATNLFAPLSEQTKKDVLVEFRAGRLHFDSNSKWVRPDKRKGLVQLKMMENLIHFVWKDRTTGTVETDLMLFPEEATFRKVEEAKGRVYVLEFKTNDNKLFFWMQEPKDDKDKENAENINKYINNPPQPGASGANSAGNGGLLDLVGGLGLDHNQLMQFFSGSGALGGLTPGSRGGNRGSASSGAAASPPASPSPSVPQATQQQQQQQQQPAAPAVQLETLQNILSSFTSRTQDQEKGPSLKEVVNSEEIVKSGLFDNPQVVQKLAEFLPEGGPVNAQNLKDNIQSPQFKQAVAMFNQALRSGQLATVMSSFGLDASSIGPDANIEDFLMAIQKKAKEEQEKEKGEKGEKDDKMDTDH